MAVLDKFGKVSCTCTSQKNGGTSNMNCSDGEIRKFHLVELHNVITYNSGGVINCVNYYYIYIFCNRLINCTKLLEAQLSCPSVISSCDIIDPTSTTY